MNVALRVDSFGRIVCDLGSGGANVIVTSSDRVSASSSLLAALADAQTSGYGECFWLEGSGEYRWMLRRDADVLTIVLLWSRGTLTGWEHLLRGETSFDDFSSRVGQALARLGS